MNDDHCQLSWQSRERPPVRFSLGCPSLAPVSVWQIWLLALCAGYPSASTSQAQDSPVHALSSNVLVSPIVLPVVDPRAKISQIKVIANFEDSPAMAELELDMAKVEFNDFGDPLRIGTPDVRKI